MKRRILLYIGVLLLGGAIVAQAWFFGPVGGESFFGQNPTAAAPGGGGPAAGDGLLLEAADYLLLETGDYLLLE